MIRILELILSASSIALVFGLSGMAIYEFIAIYTNKVPPISDIIKVNLNEKKHFHLILLLMMIACLLIGHFLFY